MSQKQLALLLAVLLILTLIIKTLHPAIAFTQDLGRHLKLGQIILGGKTVPKTNLFSYTYPDFPFINHHWLSEVIFFLLYSIGGINTLIILKVILLTLSFTLALVVAKRHSSLATSALTGILLLPVFLERTHIRPEIFSFLLFSIFIYILSQQTNHLTRPVNSLDRSSHPERAQRDARPEWNRRVASRAVEGPPLNHTVRLFLLPLILLLWVNLHIYFAAGLALITFYVTEKIIRKENIKHHLLFLVSCYLLLVLNPNGLSGALLPLKIFTAYGYSIVENQTPFFLSVVLPSFAITTFKVSLVATALALLHHLKHKHIFASLSLIFFTALALKQIRHFPLYALISLPLVSQALHPYLTKSLNYLERLRHLFDPERSRGAERAWRDARPEWNRRVASRAVEGPLIILLLIAVFWQSYSAVTALTRTPPALGIPPHLHEPFEFFKNQKLKGPIFNNFDIGGLAIYHLYPQEKLFVDNRPEAFPPEFFQEIYIPMQQNPTIFAQLDSQYQFNTIIFHHTDITPWAKSFLSFITQNPNWLIVYLDDRTIILVKKSTLPPNLEDKIISPSTATAKLTSLLSTSDPGTLKRLLHFFLVANWPEAALYTQQRLRFLTR